MEVPRITLEFGHQKARLTSLFLGSAGILGVAAMRRSAFAAVLLLFSTVVNALAGGRVALVVGVSNYEHAGRLANTLNDANDMAATLRRLSFDVETLLDPNRFALEGAVRRYGDRDRKSTRLNSSH